jgi:hypothetical protein
MQRYLEHVEGKGVPWTRVYRPIRVEKVYTAAGPFEEDRVTKEFMATYGLDHVRGGTYTTFSLTMEQRLFLQKEFQTAADTCFSCGEYGHFASECLTTSRFYPKQNAVSNAVRMYFLMPLTTFSTPEKKTIDVIRFDTFTESF